MRITNHDLHVEVIALKTKVGIIESEVEINRNFKHDTNAILHTHGGIIRTTIDQQRNTADAIVHLTKVVEGALKDIGTIINIKFMLVGGAAVGSVMIAGVIFMFKMYLDYYR